jgi:hypothetical protein
MTASQPSKSAHTTRRLSTGHGRVRSDITMSPQIVRQVATFDAPRRPFVSRFTGAQLVASTRSKSASSPAALKSP